MIADERERGKGDRRYLSLRMVISHAQALVRPNLWYNHVADPKVSVNHGADIKCGNDRHSSYFCGSVGRQSSLADQNFNMAQHPGAI